MILSYVDPMSSVTLFVICSLMMRILSGNLNLIRLNAYTNCWVLNLLMYVPIAIKMRIFMSNDQKDLVYASAQEILKLHVVYIFWTCKPVDIRMIVQVLYIALFVNFVEYSVLEVKIWTPGCMVLRSLRISSFILWADTPTVSSVHSLITTHSMYPFHLS